MKYTKGNQTYSLEGLPLVKMSFTDGIDFTETPWAVRGPDGKYILQNHAVAFVPHESWGAMFDQSHISFLPLLEAQTLELHPDAWKEYISHGIINEQGDYINKRV